VGKAEPEMFLPPTIASESGEPKIWGASLGNIGGLAARFPHSLRKICEGCFFARNLKPVVIIRAGCSYGSARADLKNL
jgi:hypothetical protein